MSIHLPPYTRRRFMAVSAGAGVSVLGAAARTAVGPERMILLADTHIPTDPKKSHHNTPLAGNLKKVVAEILETVKQEPAGGVVINGDCAFLIGEASNYRTLAKLIEPLRSNGLPVHLTMGNHDDRDRMFEVMSDYKPEHPPVAGKFVTVLESRFANWFFLDSLLKVNLVTGEFGEAQLAWLSAALAARPDKPAILVGHHYLQADPAAKQIMGLKDTPAFRELLKKHAQVSAYIFGHSHDWQVRTDEKLGVHFINLPPTAYVFKKDRPNGWVMASLSRQGLELKLHTLDKAHPEHGVVRALPWAGVTSEK